MPRYSFGEGSGYTFKVTATAASNTAKVRPGRWMLTVQTDTVEIHGIKSSIGAGEGTPLPPNYVIDELVVDSEQTWCFRSASGFGVVWFTQLS